MCRVPRGGMCGMSGGGGEVAHRRAEHLHAEDVERLAAHVLRPHVHDALEAEERADRRRRDAVLAGARLGDDPLLAEAEREEALADGVVDLVRAGEGELLALQPDLRAAALLGQALREVQRRRPADVPAAGEEGARRRQRIAAEQNCAELRAAELRAAELRGRTAFASRRLAPGRRGRPSPRRTAPRARGAPRPASLARSGRQTRQSAPPTPRRAPGSARRWRRPARSSAASSGRPASR